METRPRLLDLCSGIGGFSLAASWLGIETIGFCEIDPFCQRVLAKNFPGVPLHDDLRTLTGTIVHGWLGRNQDEIAAYADRQSQPEQSVDARSRRGFVVSRGLDLITAGYPCQPFSHAGKRLGTEDDRHLWPHIARLVAELRPRYCLFENVAGHISLGLDDVLSDLEALNYACWPVVVPACAVNAPHRRDRVWIVADAEGAGRQPLTGSMAGSPTTPLRESEGSGNVRRSSEREGQPASRREDVADAKDGRLRRRESLRETGQPALSHEAIESWWAAEPDVGRVAHGIPRRVDRLRGLGNAIVPQVAYVILSSMLAVA